MSIKHLEQNFLHALEGLIIVHLNKVHLETLPMRTSGTQGKQLPVERKDVDSTGGSQGQEDHKT